MITLDAMVENGDVIQVLSNTTFVPIAEIEDDIEKSCSGHITYKVKNDSQYYRQRFCLYVGEQLFSELRHREVDFIVSLGEMLERRFKEQGMMVVEVSLPKSHGYSGRSFGYYSTKRLFNNAGIKGFGE